MEEEDEGRVKEAGNRVRRRRERGGKGGEQDEEEDVEKSIVSYS